MHHILPSAVAYAQELQGTGIVLGLSPASHLRPGLTYSQPELNKEIFSIEEFQQEVFNSVELTGGVSEYEIFVHEISDAVASAANSHVAMARQIGALAMEYADRVRNYASQQADVSAASTFDIVKDDLGALFSRESVQSDLQSYSTYLVEYRHGALCHGGRTNEELRAMLLSYGTSFVETLDETLSFYDPNFLQAIWFGLISSASGFQSPYNLSNLGNLPPAESVTVSFFGKLMVDYIRREVPSDAIDTLAKFEAAAENLSSFLEYKTGAAYVAYRNANERKNVVCSYDYENRRIVVNGTAYRVWLESGGTPEVLLGCLIGGKSAYTAESLNVVTPDALRLWNTYNATHSQEYDVRCASLLRSLYTALFIEGMAQVQTFEEGYRKDHPQHAELASEQVAQIVKSKGIRELSNIDEMALQLIAGVRFCYTPALMILTEINRIKTAHPDTDPREAALVAACDYVAEYLVGQMLVNKAK